MATCTPVNLPAARADYCAPDINFGSVDKIYLGNEGNPFTDWTSLAEWTSRIDNTDDGTTVTAIKELHIEGDKPRPERGEVKFSQGRKAYTTPDHTLNITVDETHTDNYALVKWLDANAGQKITVWYQAGKYLYGGNDGISSTLVLDDVIPRSDEELNVFEGEVTWEGNHPDRIVNPMA